LPIKIHFYTNSRYDYYWELLRDYACYFETVKDVNKAEVIVSNTLISRICPYGEKGVPIVNPIEFFLKYIPKVEYTTEQVENIIMMINSKDEASRTLGMKLLGKVDVLSHKALFLGFNAAMYNHACVPFIVAVILHVKSLP